MKDILKTLERVAVVFGVLLTFFAVIEVLRAYQILYDTNPYAGYGFLVVVALLLAYVVWQVRAIFAYRMALKPPALPGEGSLTDKQVKIFRRHMQRVARRFAENPILASEHLDEVDAMRMAVESLPETGNDDGNVFRSAVEAIEREHISPLLKHLDRHAEGVVSDNVGLVSLGTALSPYRSVDMYIVLARNARMVNQILRIYRTRPTPGETVKVFYDIVRVVAAVNLINAMDNVWTGIGRHVPFIGRYGEAMSEGLFSGLLTSVAGHAAIDRCRSYRPWSREEAVRTYRGKLQRWGLDVFGILRRHGIDRIFGRPKKIGDAGPDDEPEVPPEAEHLSDHPRWNPFTKKKTADA